MNAPYLDDKADIDLIDGLHVGSPPVGSPPARPFMPPAFSDSEDKSAHFQYILNVGVKMADTDNGQAHDIFSHFFPNTNLQKFSIKDYVQFVLIVSKATDKKPF